MSRLYLASTLCFALVSPLALCAQEYTIGPAAFHIQQAQENCESIGRTLAGFDEPADLEIITGLCRDVPESSPDFCFLRYVVNETQDGHVSILDGTPMPDPFGYFQEPPSYPSGLNVMVRRHFPVLIEILNVGRPICQWTEPPLFADGFESGDLLEWLDAVP